ncbi:arsenate reductase (glutaredoxin) [Luteimonas pelagia]
MDPSPRLFHNPRCSKSREALHLLASRNVGFEEVRYLDTPPSRETLGWLAQRIEGGARAMVRKGEPAFAAHGLDRDGVGDDAILDAIAADPSLLERPILVVGERAVIGRPPERILELLGNDAG